MTAVDSSRVELAHADLDWTPVFEADLTGKNAGEHCASCGETFPHTSDRCFYARRAVIAP